MVDPKPHTLLVKVPSTSRGAQRVVKETVQSAGTSVSGQLDPRTPSYALDRWGVSAQRPVEFMVDPDDADYFRKGGVCDGAEGELVDLTGRTFEVAAPPQKWEYGQHADCATILLEETT